MYQLTYAEGGEAHDQQRLAGIMDQLANHRTSEPDRLGVAGRTANHNLTSVCRRLTGDVSGAFEGEGDRWARKLWIDGLPRVDQLCCGAAHGKAWSCLDQLGTRSGVHCGLGSQYLRPSCDVTWWKSLGEFGDGLGETLSSRRH